jgi:hypothetical protein
MKYVKVISGGQTGCDLGALCAAHDIGLNTGGYACSGYLNENGYKDVRLQKRLGLIDKTYSYKRRTQANIEISDATLVIAKVLNSPGTALMLKLAGQYNKPLFVFGMTYKQDEYNLAKNSLIEWLLFGKYDILNIGGNRESVAPGIQKYTYNMLIKILNKYEDILWEQFVEKKMNDKKGNKLYSTSSF